MTPMGIGKEIRRRRRALHMTLMDLEAAVGVDNGNLSRIERDMQHPSPAVLERIVGALGCTVPDLYLGDAGDFNTEATPIGTRRVPVISYIEAGMLTESSDSFAPGAAHEFILTDLDVSSSAFALTIRGRSMEPEFREGDKVIIDPDVQPQPGDYVAAANGSAEEGATFKKYRPRGIDSRGEVVFELAPLNEDFPSMRSDQVPLRILGTMVEHRRYRRR